MKKREMKWYKWIEVENEVNSDRKKKYNTVHLFLLTLINEALI